MSNQRFSAVVFCISLLFLLLVSCTKGNDFREEIEEKPIVIDEKITIDVETILTDVSEGPVGLCGSFLLDSDLNNNRNKTMVEVFTENKIHNYRFPMGALAENYLFHAPGDYSDAINGLRPEVCSMEKPPANWTEFVGANGTFKGCMDFDEFMGVCINADADPIIMLTSYGWKLPGAKVSRQQCIDNAVEWVRYANVTRRWNIKYWEVGNEVDIHADIISLSEYMDFFKDVTLAMKAVDPNIKVGIGILNGSSTDYYKYAFENFSGILDFVVVHSYQSGISNYNDYKSNTWDYVSSISTLNSTINTYASPELKNRLEILVTEFSSFSPGGDWENSGNNIYKALCNFEKLMNALSMFDRIRTMNFWVTQSPWGDTNTVDDADALDHNNNLTAMGKTLALASEFLKEKMVQAPRVSGSVRTYASYDTETKALAIWLVNKKDAKVTAKVNLDNYSGGFKNQVFVFTGSSPQSTTYKYDQISSLNFSENSFTTVLDPFSITVINLGGDN